MVKKWLPGIKMEIEYYLQQSQLSHYPERKISEFQLRIKDLEKEYKRFISKLRVLDPTCKHHPWSPRAYTRKRADNTTLKTQCCDWLEESRGSGSGVEAAVAYKSSSNEREDPISQPEGKHNPTVERSEPVCGDQDLPLSFDRTRLAMAVAGFPGRGLSLSTPNPGLPNLSGSLLGHGRTPGTTPSATGVHGGERESAHLGPGTDTTERLPEMRGLVGLGCYSSSDEDT